MTASIVIGTLCLNEMEWLPKLYEQHKDWPGLRNWVFVEAADQEYVNANPEMVSGRGLSVDDTSEYLRQLSKDDDRVIYIPYGISTHEDPAQGKCAARQRYLDVANKVKPGFVLTLDADEFYVLHDQKTMMNALRASQGVMGIVIPYRNIWRPPSIVNEPLFQYEVIGVLWRVVVCKFWRWVNGMSYDGNHNSPSSGGVLLNRSLLRMDRQKFPPQFVHMGFASDKRTRIAKNRYYVQRGEGRNDHRGNYVKSRGAFDEWRPGDMLPNKDKVIPYTGQIPEVFIDECQDG